MEDLKLIGTRIKNVRETLGFSLDKFAKGMGVSSKILEDVENGKIKAEFDILYHLAKVYHVDLDFIFYGRIPSKEGKNNPEHTIFGFDFGAFNPAVKVMLKEMAESQDFLESIIGHFDKFLAGNESLIEQETEESRKQKTE